MRIPGAFLISAGLRGPARAAVAVCAATAAAVVVLEALDGPTVLSTIGMVLSGLLALAVVLLADARPAAVGVAAAASAVVSLTFGVVPALRPEHTFGLIEFLVLSLAVIRLVMQYPARRAAAPAVLTAAAVASLPARIDFHPGDTASVPQDDGTAALLATMLTGWVLFLALLGAYLRLLESRRADAERLARETERLDYARDLHDYVAHHVTAIVAQTRALRFVAGAGAMPSPAELDALLGGVEQAGSQALTSMRTLVAVLRDPAPGAVPAHRDLDEMLAAVVGGLPPGVPPPIVSVDDALSRLPLRPAVLDAAHHTVLEALTNVLRHTTGVTRIDIGARLHPDHPGLAEISVLNDGEPARSPLPAGGFGLTGLAERVHAAGGELAAGPVTSGWRVSALLPVTGRTRTGALRSSRHDHPDSPGR